MFHILVTLTHCVVLTWTENISNYERKVFVMVACRLLDMEFYLDHRTEGLIEVLSPYVDRL